MKRIYKSEIEKDSRNPNIIRQIFTANQINIEEEEKEIYIQFAESIENTIIHSLFFYIPNENVDEYDNLYVEFNDEGNGLFGGQIGTIELTDEHLTLSPLGNNVLRSGRVSYSPEADPFNRDSASSTVKINQILVKHSAGIELLSKLDLLFQTFSKYDVIYLPKL